MAPADDGSASIRPSQRGLGDMEPAEFREAAGQVAEQVASYLENLESFDVLPRVSVGEIRDRLAADPPAAPEAFEAILDDYRRLIEPNITHWQHPGFMGYFPSVASGPGILGEWLAAGLNSNVMFWRNAPASTELEETVVVWLRSMLGLPEAFDGMLTDTASISSLLSLVAARSVVEEFDTHEHGLAGGPRLRMYASTEAHASIEKAAVATGIGRRGVRRIEVDRDFAMRADRLEAAIAEDRAAGWRPFCVVATLGTTSSTSLDPARAIGEICRREKLWFHIDAAYAGAAAIAPEMRSLFDGWELADSLIFNPHKWMFTPFDASLLLFRKPEAFRQAFSLVPEYLRTAVRDEAHNYNEYGIQLGRRFRALKLWFQIRWFGVEGIAARIREHCRMAREFASWVAAEEGWELLAPVPFATICFRHAPAAERGDEAALERRNAALLDAINRSGRFYLSHTKLDGRYTLRVSLGNPRASMKHVEGCWALLREIAAGNP